MARDDVPDIPLVDWEAASEELNAELGAGKSKTRRRRSTGTAKRDKPALQPWKAGAIAAHVTRLYKLAAFLSRARGATELAEAIEMTAEPAGRAWEKLAKQQRYEWLRRFFEWSMATGDLGDLAMAHAPLAMYVANRAGLFGTVAQEFQTELNNEMNNTDGKVAA